MWLLTDGEFITFTMCTTSPNMGTRFAGNALASRSSQCKKQWVTKIKFVLVRIFPKTNAFMLLGIVLSGFSYFFSCCRPEHLICNGFAGGNINVSSRGFNCIYISQSKYASYRVLKLVQANPDMFFRSWQRVQVCVTFLRLGLHASESFDSPHFISYRPLNTLIDYKLTCLDIILACMSFTILSSFCLFNWKTCCSFFPSWKPASR